VAEKQYGPLSRRNDRCAIQGDWKAGGGRGQQLADAQTATFPR